MTQLTLFLISVFALAGCAEMPRPETYSVGGSPEILSYDEAKKAINATSTKLVRLDQPTQIVKAVPPRYPDAALRDGIEGAILVEITVDERGRVVDASPVGRPNELLADAAVSAVRQWEFRPHTENGSPTKVRLRQSIVFKLDPP